MKKKTQEYIDDKIVKVYTEAAKAIERIEHDVNVRLDQISGELLKYAESHQGNGRIISDERTSVPQYPFGIQEQGPPPVPVGGGDHPPTNWPPTPRELADSVIAARSNHVHVISIYNKLKEDPMYADIYCECGANERIRADEIDIGYSGRAKHLPRGWQMPPAGSGIRQDVVMP